MAKEKSASPMTDYPAPPSPHSGKGSFAGGLAKEFATRKPNYTVISPVQFCDPYGPSKGKLPTDDSSPMSEQITPGKPKGAM